ncbi:unnamed protein product [Caenorhabditis sp. 36 PRJEB53466]|nr:unnamed protein product [Caenorhabditis sp. 36 PRJEB53466]
MLTQPFLLCFLVFASILAVTMAAKDDKMEDTTKLAAVPTSVFAGIGAIVSNDSRLHRSVALLLLVLASAFLVANAATDVKEAGRLHRTRRRGDSRERTVLNGRSATHPASIRNKMTIYMRSHDNK